MRTSAILAMFAGLLLSTQAAAEDIPAKRVSAVGPGYPASCRPPAGEEATPQIVVVTYGVTRDGKAENIRVMESSNPCFNDAAIAVVRSWYFEPRSVDGKPTAQEDMESTFIFRLEEETQTEDFDARPIKRVPPRYPQECMAHASAEESVIVSFTVTAEGTTKDIDVIETTNRCLSRAAVASIRQWEYEPKTVAGNPVERKGVQTTIKFILDPGFGPETYPMRGKVRNMVRRIQGYITDGEIDRALSELAKLEAEFGDTFTHPEAATFYQLRGAARLSKKDYAGALDDFRAALANGLQGESADAIRDVIKQLEQVVAVQAAQEAAEKAGEGSGEQ